MNKNINSKNEVLNRSTNSSFAKSDKLASPRPNISSQNEYSGKEQKTQSSFNMISFHSPLSLTDHTIVLDLDETLVHSCEDMSEYTKLNVEHNPELRELSQSNRFYHISLLDDDKNPSSQRSDLWGITRPHLRQFLTFCFNYFDQVCIWSAGQTNYVETLIKLLLKDIQSPAVIYTNTKCMPRGDGSLQKPLLKLIDENPHLNLSLEHTFMLDDRRTVFSDCNPSNGILIPVYDPAPDPTSLKSDDRCFQQLIRWLMLPEVIMADDIRMLDKSCIFRNTDLNEQMYSQSKAQSRSKYSSPMPQPLQRSINPVSSSKSNSSSSSRSPRYSKTDPYDQNLMHKDQSLQKRSQSPRKNPMLSQVAHNDGSIDNINDRTDDKYQREHRSPRVIRSPRAQQSHTPKSNITKSSPRSSSKSLQSSRRSRLQSPRGQTSENDSSSNQMLVKPSLYSRKPILTRSNSTRTFSDSRSSRSSKNSADPTQTRVQTMRIVS